MEKVILPNTQRSDNSFYVVLVEIGREYKVTVFNIGSYIGRIDAVTNESIVMSKLRPCEQGVPAVSKYTIHGKQDGAIFPTEEIYDLEQV